MRLLGLGCAAAIAAPVLFASPASAEQQVRVGEMLRYCQGEASAEFGVNPRYIEMGDLVENDGGARIASGSYKEADGAVTEFRCRFSPKNRFRWVRKGATHEDAAPQNASAGPSDRQLRACNAVQDRYGEVVETSPLKPGAYEIILNYDDGEYVCDVEADGKVTYFAKLR